MKHRSIIIKTSLHLLPFWVLMAVSHVSCGQKAFERELKRLYKETVPLVKSEE